VAGVARATVLDVVEAPAVGQARAAVQGTEFARSTTFLLPGTTNDFGNQTTAPPGFVSPFGVNACSVNN